MFKIVFFFNSTKYLLRIVRIAKTIKKSTIDRSLSAPKITADVENKFNLKVNPQTIRKRLNAALGKQLLKKPQMDGKSENELVS